MTTDLQGWPRLEIEVFWRDAHGRSDFAGYAVAPVPTTQGTHAVTCPVWRPRGSKKDRLAAFFVGGYPRLKNEELVYGIADKEDATRLSRSMGKMRVASEGVGTVHLSLSVCARHAPL